VPPCSWGSHPADDPGGAVSRRFGGAADVCPDGGAVLPFGGGGARPQPGVRHRPCAPALATTYRTAAGTLQAAHGEAILASLVDTLDWVTRGAGAVLRGFPSPLLAAADHLPVDTTPEAIGREMASRLEGHGQRLVPAPAAPTGGGSSTRAPFSGEPAATALPFYGSGYSYSAAGAPASGHALYGRRYSSAEAGPSRTPCSTWGLTHRGQGPARQYHFDPPAHENYQGYARDDVPPSPDRGLRPVPLWEPRV